MHIPPQCNEKVFERTPTHMVKDVVEAAKIIVPSKALGKFKNRNASITALRQHLRSHIRDPNETFDIQSAKRKLGLLGQGWDRHWQREVQCQVACEVHCQIAWSAASARYSFSEAI